LDGTLYLRLPLVRALGASHPIAAERFPLGGMRVMRPVGDAWRDGHSAAGSDNLGRAREAGLPPAVRAASDHHARTGAVRYPRAAAARFDTRSDS